VTLALKEHLHEASMESVPMVSYVQLSMATMQSEYIEKEIKKTNKMQMYGLKNGFDCGEDKGIACVLLLRFFNGRRISPNTIIVAALNNKVHNNRKVVGPDRNGHLFNALRQ
jgi:hypothetical protein